MRKRPSSDAFGNDNSSSTSSSASSGRSPAVLPAQFFSPGTELSPTLDAVARLRRRSVPAAAAPSPVSESAMLLARASFGPGNASSSNTSSAGEFLPVAADGASAAAAPRAAVAFRRRPGATSTMPSVR